MISVSKEYMLNAGIEKLHSYFALKLMSQKINISY